MQPQRQITLDELNALRDQALMDRAMYDSAQSVQSSRAPLPVGQAVSGLPETHQGSLGAFVKARGLSPLEADVAKIKEDALLQDVGLLPVDARYIPRERPSLKSSNTRLGDMVARATTPQAGAVLTGLHDTVDQVVEHAPQFAKDLSGYTLVEDGVKNFSEGYDEGSPLRVAGGVAEVGLAALPYSGGLASAAFRTAPRFVGTNAAYMASPLVAAGVLSPEEAQAEAPSDQLDQQVRAMTTAGDRLRARRLELIGTLIDPDIVLKDKTAIKGLQRKIGVGTDGQWGDGTRASIKAYNKRQQRLIDEVDQELQKYSPEAIASFRQRQGEVIARADSEASKEFWSRPTREIAPWLPYVTGLAGVYGGYKLGNSIARRNATRANDEAAELSERWLGDITAARDPSDMVAAGNAARASQHYGEAMDDITSRNIEPGLATYLASGGIADAGILTPDLMDKFRGIDDPEASLLGFLSRAVPGYAIGMAAGKAGGQLGARRDPVRRYDAETAGLRDMLEYKGGPSSYYKNELNKLGDATGGAENSLRRRRELLDSEAQRAESQQLDHDAELRRARLAAEGSLFQREGLRGVLGGLVNGRLSRGASDPQPQTQRQQSDDLSSRKASGERVEQIEYQNSTKGQQQQLTARPRHSDKKRAAVEKGLENGKSVKELHKKHEVPERTIYEWRKEMSRARRMSELESKAGKPE